MTAQPRIKLQTMVDAIRNAQLVRQGGAPAFFRVPGGHWTHMVVPGWPLDMPFVSSAGIIVDYVRWPEFLKKRYHQALILASGDER